MQTTLIDAKIKDRKNVPYSILNGNQNKMKG